MGCLATITKGHLATVTNGCLATVMSTVLHEMEFTLRSMQVYITFYSCSPMFSTGLLTTTSWMATS